MKTSKPSRILIVAALTSILFGCTKQSSPGQPGEPPDSNLENFNGNGTFTGVGGGNGIDGKMTELWVKNIQALPEYKAHVVPILRKMSGGRPDVLLVYLNWAAKSKRWYFVPKSFDVLPQEKTKLAFESDQLALHSEREIYIDARAYVKLNHRERATLLLHEMVMGARLLMKKPALEQCQALSSSEEIDLCKDPTYQKIAINPKVPEGEEKTLDGNDHVDVRTMTTALLEPNQDFSAMNIYVLRKRLNYSFPWDTTISRLTYNDFMKILTRTQLAETKLIAQHPCVIGRRAEPQYGTGATSLMFGFVTTEQDQANFKSSVIDLTFARNDQIRWFSPFIISSEANFSASPIDATGMIDPFGSEQVIDVVTLRPTYSYSGSPGAPMQQIVEIYISRGTSAQITGFKIINVRGMEKESGSTSYIKNYEWVPVNGSPTVLCKQ